MIKHIVCWKVKEARKGAIDNAREIKRRLEALVGMIPQIRALEVGIDFNRSQAAYDVALYSEFDTKEALEVYQEHPLYESVKQFVLSVAEARVVVDYEV